MRKGRVGVAKVAVLCSAAGLVGCASGGAPGGSSGGTSAVVVPATGTPSMDELYEAGDYAGALRAFQADASLGMQEKSLYRAAIASAMPGHSGHGRSRALGLLTRLLTEHPESDYATEARLIIALLEEEAALLRTNGRLEQELEQLKAIDLGEGP